MQKVILGCVCALGLFSTELLAVGTCFPPPSGEGSDASMKCLDKTDVELDKRITDNKVAIDGVNGRVDAVDAKVNGLGAQVADNTAAINSNKVAIDGVNGRVDAVDAKVNGLGAQVADNTAAINSNKAAIDGVNGRVDAVDAKVNGLDAGIKENSAAIKNNDVAINTRVDGIEGRVNQNTTAIEDLNNAFKDVIKAEATATALNERIDSVESKLADTDKRLTAGIAGVAAIASIPYVTTNKFSYGLGVAQYRDGNAIAGGVQFSPKDSNLNARITAAYDSSSNASVGVGVAGGW